MKSNLESVGVRTCVVVKSVALVVLVVVLVIVLVVVLVIFVEIDCGSDCDSVGSAIVVVVIVVVVGSFSEQNVFSTAFHLQASSSNHEKKSLKLKFRTKIICG